MSIFGAAVTQCHRLGDLNNRAYNLTTMEARGWKSSLIPSKGCEGRLCCRPLSVTCRWPFHPCVSFFFFNLFGCARCYLRHAGASVVACRSSSPTRDQIQDPCIGNMESQSLDHKGSPFPVFLYIIFPLYVSLCPDSTFLGAPVILDWGPL